MSITLITFTTNKPGLEQTNKQTKQSGTGLKIKRWEKESELSFEGNLAVSKFGPELNKTI